MISGSVVVSEDIQGQYQAAELAYAQERFDEAEEIALSVLEIIKKDSEPVDNDGRENAKFSAWESPLTLLLGHIAHHGRHQPKEAIEWYKRSLTATEEPTLQEIAKDGIKQCEASNSTPAITNLLQDPFINAQATPSKGGDQPTAMPWQDTLIQPIETNTTSQFSSTKSSEGIVDKQTNNEKTEKDSFQPNPPQTSEEPKDNNKSLSTTNTKSQSSHDDSDQPREWLKDSWIRISI